MAYGFPEGFLFAIGENPAASEAFRAMGSEERQALFLRARHAQGKDELRRLADSLAASIQEYPQAF